MYNCKIAQLKSKSDFNQNCHLIGTQFQNWTVIIVVPIRIIHNLICKPYMPKLSYIRLPQAKVWMFKHTHHPQHVLFPIPNFQMFYAAQIFAPKKTENLNSAILAIQRFRVRAPNQERQNWRSSGRAIFLFNFNY